MAIQATYQTPHGLKLDNAYIKINTFNGNKETVNFDVLVYHSQADYDEGRPALDQRFYGVPYTDGMTIAALYGYLKQCHEYVNPIDA